MPAPAAAPAPPGLSALADAAPGYDVVDAVLDNGLCVHVNQDRSAPVAAVNVWYGVGSRHEAPGRTGFAHLFEHVMFQGSRNVRKGEHLEAMQGIGAEVNGTTSFERTNYFETVPLQHLDLALWLEADRMGSLLDALDQENLDNQREVVKNEKRQRYDNQPYGELFLHLVGLAFPDGPYHHLPIGSMADLDAATLEDVRTFFTTWYVPSNAHLSVVGDVEPDDVLRRVERWFGGIDAGPAAPAPPPATAPRTAPARSDTTDGVSQTRVVTSWPVAPLDHADHPAAQTLAAVLGSGRGSLLHRRLVVERQLLQPGAGAGVLDLAGTCSLLMVDGLLAPGVAVGEVEQAVTALVREVAEQDLAAADLERATALRVASVLREQCDVTRRADALNRGALLRGSSAALNRDAEDALAVSPADVQRLASALREPAATVVIAPAEAS